MTRYPPIIQAVVATAMIAAATLVAAIGAPPISLATGQITLA